MNRVMPNVIDSEDVRRLGLRGAVAAKYPHVALSDEESGLSREGFDEFRGVDLTTRRRVRVLLQYRIMMNDWVSRVCEAQV